jgi:hypothetical protein
VPLGFGDGVLLGVGDGVPLGVGDGVIVGAAVGVDDGVGDGMSVGVAVAEADGEGAAAKVDGKGLGAGDALAGAMTATVEAVTAEVSCTFAYAPAVPAGKVAVVATAALDEPAIAAAAPAVTAPRMVRTVRFALRR